MMGMFDDVRCLYKMPFGDLSGEEFQTKDTNAQHLDNYEIRADGTLWHEEYDIRIEQSDDAPLGIWEHRDNPRWVHESEVTGSIEIYREQYRIVFWFRNGVVKEAVFYRDDIEIHP
jgi:hypothetical protein